MLGQFGQYQAKKKGAKQPPAAQGQVPTGAGSTKAPNAPTNGRNK